MSDHYPRTAEAFMRDAAALQSAGSHRNACYLAGYVVECTLKALIESSDPGKAVWSHDLISLRERLADLSVRAGQSAAKYGDLQQLAPTITGQQRAPGRDRHGVKHFCDWDPLHRYDGSRWTNPAKSAAYIAEAGRALSILHQMLLDGGLR